MLGSAQSFGLLGTKCRRDRAIRPSQPSFRGLVDRPEPWRRDGKNAAFSFDQDIARIGRGGRDEGDPAGLSGCCLVAYPFCQGAGLNMTAFADEVANARIWAGFHYRFWTR